MNLLHFSPEFASEAVEAAENGIFLSVKRSSKSTCGVHVVFSFHWINFNNDKDKGEISMLNEKKKKHLEIFYWCNWVYQYHFWTEVIKPREDIFDDQSAALSW